MGGFPFETRDVLTLMGYHVPSGKDSIYIPCPYCMGKKKSLNFKLSKNVFRCNKNDDHHGNILTFYRDQMGLSDNKEAYRQIMDRLQMGDKPSVVKAAVSSDEEKEVKMASADKRNLFYTKLLKQFSLSKKNTEDLLKRGFTEEEIKALGYKTVPKPENVEEIGAALKAMNLSSESFEGIPGTYVSSKDNWWLKIWKGGIGVKYLDIFGRCQMLNVRKNEEERQIDKDGEKECKYYYISSNGKKSGTSAKQVIHYAGKRHKAKNGLMVLDAPANGKAYITEGAMKGDLYHCISGNLAICTPGVNCLGALKKEIPYIKKLGIKEICIAYDMDRVKNIEVLIALQKLGMFLIDKGFKVSVKEWSTTITYFDGSLGNLDSRKNFVMTPDVYQKALKDAEYNKVSVEEILTSRIIKRAAEIGRTDFLFAFESSKEARENMEIYYQFKKLCSDNNVTLKPCFWKLVYKGIDDFYVHKERGVEA
jgi:hypothetical protein